jgi:hypothetical protein
MGFSMDSTAIGLSSQMNLRDVDAQNVSLAAAAEMDELSAFAQSRLQKSEEYAAKEKTRLHEIVRDEEKELFAKESKELEWTHEV